MAEGWIALYRKLLEDALWKKFKPEQKTIMITLLLMASYKENEWIWKGEKYKVQPGQVITSLNSIKEKAGEGISIQNIRTTLVLLEKYEFLTSESTNKNRLITVANWGKYQSKDNELTSTSTSIQQATNKQLTTINKVTIETKKQKSLYPYQDIVNAYHEICVSFPKIKELTPKRKTVISNWFKSGGTLEEIKETFTKAEESDFLTGRKGKGAGFGFDWIIKAENRIKILENNYCNREGKNKNNKNLSDVNWDKIFGKEKEENL